ncbi:hypothetical protein MMC21_004885 [Puttea exsequens]|nr:hypothetical protein [Puttea exsequens]
MPFRAKMKRALGRTNSSGALSKTDTAQSKKPKKEKLPNNVYKPGEKMPRLKYRGPWNQAHQDNLSSFSFGDAWKRRKSSANEEYSPMGSRLVSRRPSAWSRLSRLGSRKSSFVGGEEKGKVGSRRVSMAGLGEAEGDDDIGNVGLSRQQTAENKRSRTAEQLPPVGDKMEGLESQKKMTNGDTHGLAAQKTITNGRPFTEDDLVHAFSYTTMKASERKGELGRLWDTLGAALIQLTVDITSLGRPKNQDS